MHVPGHYLDPTTCAATAAAAAGALGIAAVKARREGLRPAWLAATTSAGIFAVQLVNFPISSGTSGHLVGGVLAGMLLGPWVGMWSVALVLAVQCLLFGDGGLATLGANVLNMAVIGAAIGAGLRQVMAKPEGSLAKKLTISAAGGWLAVVAGAAICAFELAASGKFPLADALPAMVSVHALIGISEAFVSAAIAALVLKSAPELFAARDKVAGTLRVPSALASGVRILPTLGLATAMLIAAVLAPLASQLPDGLETVASRLGIGESTVASHAPLQDYLIPRIDSHFLSTALAGIIGVLIVYAIACGWELAVRRRELTTAPARKV